MEQVDTAVNVRCLCIGIQMGWEGGNSIPMGIEGVPGVGKTEIVQQLGELFEAHLSSKGISNTWAFRTFAGPQMLAEDIAGIGHLDKDAKALVRWPLIGVRKLKEASYGVAFFDELTAASQAVGGSMLTAVQSGLYGDTQLPKTIAHIAAWNPPECAAGGRDLSFPEINRFCVLHWSLNTNDWLDHNMGGPGAVAHAVFLPTGWEAKNKLRASILVNGFIQANPKYLNSLESGETTERDIGKPWSSGRAWSNVTRCLAACYSLGLDANGEEASILVRGLVGEGIARLFTGYCREMDLPNPEDIIAEAMVYKKSESKEARSARLLAKIPDSCKRHDKLKMTLEGVARTACDVSHKDAAKRWTAVWDVIYPYILTRPDVAQDAAAFMVRTIPPGAEYGAREEITALFKLYEASGTTSF